MSSIHSKSRSTYQKLKAAMLLLSLCLMVVGSCPIQKFISHTFSVKVEVSKQPANPASLVNNTLRCSEAKEVIQSPLVEQSLQANSGYALFFLLLSTFPYWFSYLAGKGLKISLGQNDSIGSSIPLFIRNQVFRI